MPSRIRRRLRSEVQHAPSRRTDCNRVYSLAHSAAIRQKEQADQNLRQAQYRPTKDIPCLQKFPETVAGKFSSIGRIARLHEGVYMKPVCIERLRQIRKS